MPRPPTPPLPTLTPPRFQDRLRTLWWIQRGFLHGFRHGRGTGGPISAAAAIL